ncbi:hypothetical protein CDAR_371511 [Caerostris darwini]|uniref:Reverse transcriptase n=1 Tax=Caerostris darwini TaxID=1538125 RepID=A0AAV4XBH1_9ARAC|nr:hypothetical protein CDAR_371511 [Caerostris darwini]
MFGYGLIEYRIIMMNNRPQWQNNFALRCFRRYYLFVLLDAKLNQTKDYITRSFSGGKAIPSGANLAMMSWLVNSTGIRRPDLRGLLFLFARYLDAFVISLR